MIFLRSVLFNFCFFLSLLIFLLLAPLTFFGSRDFVWIFFCAWARFASFLFRVIVGVTVELRGAENIPTGAAIIASKHQSMWETFSLMNVFPNRCMVLKYEIAQFPPARWVALKTGNIILDRSAHAKALKHLIRNAEKAAKEGRQIVIFPEGTRQSIGAAPDYKPGIAALYSRLNVPCVPVALNSGLVWPRNSFIKKPGKIILDIMPAIKPGLKRAEFMARLESDIETRTAEIVKEVQVK